MVFHWLCSGRYECGTLEYYNRSFDKVTVKNPVGLQKFKRVFHKVTTTDDPYIEKVKLLNGTVMNCS